MSQVINDFIKWLTSQEFSICWSWLISFDCQVMVFWHTEATHQEAPTNQPTCLWDRDRSSKRSSNVLGSGHLLDRWERLFSSSFCSSDKSSSRTACIKSISLPIVMTNRRPNSAAVGYLTGDDSVAAFFATTSNWSILLQLTVCHIKEQTVQSILVKSGHEHSNRRHLHS